MEEEHDCAVFDRRGRRARRHEASSDGYIIERDASNGLVVQELLAEVYESLRVGNKWVRLFAPLRNKVERGRCRPRPRRIAAPRLATPHNNSSCC